MADTKAASLISTASQTVGPFFHIGFGWQFNDTIAGAGVQGEHVVVQGRVLDGDGKPVSDAVLEIWQANARGEYAHPEDKRNKQVEPGFKGYARVATDDNGAFRFNTIKPGGVPAPGGGLQAPHLNVAVFMRGLLRHLVTRMYFPDESSNDQDLVLLRVPKERRATLVANRNGNGGNTLEWNVVLQGDAETVFFDF